MKMVGLKIVTLPRSLVFSLKSCVTFDCLTGLDVTLNYLSTPSKNLTFIYLIQPANPE